MTEDRAALFGREIAAGTMPAFLLEKAIRLGPQPAVSWISDGEVRTLSWADYRSRVLAVALGFVELGVGPGRDVAILLGNCVEHMLADLATGHCGAASVSIYQTFSDEQIAHVLAESAPAVLIVEDDTAAGRVSGLISPTVPPVHIVTLRSAGDARTWSQLELMGKLVHITTIRELGSRLAALDGSAPLTYIYTSGTTGPSKAVPLTTVNILAEVESIIRAGMLDFDYRSISYLPLAHVVERLWSIYVPVRLAGHVLCCPNPSALLPLLTQFRPSYFFGVPRIFEKLRTGIESMIAAPAFAEVRPRIDAERRVLAEVSRLRREDKPVPAELDSTAALARSGTVRDIRGQIGLDKASTVACGAAAMTEDLHQFWASIGIDVLLGYGMTENGGPVTSDRPGSGTTGAVGLPMPGWNVRIEDDGEILLRGPGNTAGYRNRADATAELYTKDGWMRTGDIGRLDDAGRLHITDRKKDLLINAAGKNISPAAIESQLTGRSIIDHVMVFAEAKPFVVALITVEPNALAEFAAAQSIPADDPASLTDHPAVTAEIDRLIEEVNAVLSRPEQIKKYSVLPHPWTTRGGELTATMKLRRNVIQDRFGHVVETLYTTGP